MLFLRLRINHNTELLVTVNVFEGILTKELLKKIEYYLILVNKLLIKDEFKHKDYKEGVYKMSERFIN